MTICLPFEILTAIFEKVDDVRDLRHVRTASRTFCAVATPIAFRVLSVASTGGSAHNLGRLFDVPEIATYVREVAYCDTGVDGRKSISFQELKSGVSSPPHPINELTTWLYPRTAVGHVSQDLRHT
jgi:hypothetical protein